MKMDSAQRTRAIVLGFILIVLAVMTLWVFVMLMSNIGSIFEGVRIRDGSNWWQPVLPQMKNPCG
jgi:hypothetical protein